MKPFRLVGSLRFSRHPSTLYHIPLFPLLTAIQSTKIQQTTEDSSVLAMNISQSILQAAQFNQLQQILLEVFYILLQYELSKLKTPMCMTYMRLQLHLCIQTVKL